MQDIVLTRQKTGFIQPRFAVPDLTVASDVPDDCHVYVFYIPGIVKHDDLKNALLEYGKAAGKNIFVGSWDPSAQSLKDVLAAFQVKGSPAVVVFGNPKEMADGQQPVQSPYARIDNSNLLNDLAKASTCINATCNLFIQGQVKQALTNARNDQFKSSLDFYLGKLGSGILKFLTEGNVKFGLPAGFSISFSSGSKDASSGSKPASSGSKTGTTPSGT